MRSEEGKGQLVLGGRIKREVEMIIWGMEGRVSGRNEDIRSEEIKDLLPLGILDVVGVLSLLSLFPCLGLFSELCC